jgi:hypothetical protein
MGTSGGPEVIVTAWRGSKGWRCAEKLPHGIFVATALSCPGESEISAGDVASVHFPSFATMAVKLRRQGLVVKALKLRRCSSSVGSDRSALSSLL